MSRKTAWQAWLKGLDAFLRIDPHYKFAHSESEGLWKPASQGGLMRPIPFKLDTRGLDPQLHVDPEISRIIRSVSSFSAKLAADADAEAKANRAGKTGRVKKTEWHRHRRWDDP